MDHTKIGGLIRRLRQERGLTQRQLAERMGSGEGRLGAIDNIGAGIGEFVLVATGSAARIGCGSADAPVDAAIVGIIDDGRQWM